MPGLATTSAAVRQRMLQRNLYGPTHPYDLRADVVTRTLDAFQTAGFNLRTSPLLAGLEALVDNTPLLGVAAQQITKNILRRYNDTVNYERLGPIKVQNIFSPDPSQRVFPDRPIDWRVTPLPQPKSLVAYVDQSFSHQIPVTGLELTAWPLNAQDPARKLGGSQLFQKLGPGQRSWIQEQSARNEFNRWPKAGQKGYEQLRATPGVYRLIDSVYPEKWLNKREGAIVAEGGANYLAAPRHDRPAPKSLTAVVEQSTAPYSDKTRIIEGFGSTMMPGAGAAGVTHAANRQHVYSQDPPAPDLQIERGLLHFTDLLAKTGTDQGNAMLHETREFEGQAELKTVWRGSSACRTFTITDAYDRPERFIRSAGNLNPDSVLQNSVMPRIVPQTQNDKQRLLFSIENLAWGPDDRSGLKEEQQKGPFGGRQMWFMPYGLGYAETATANWADVALAGRIEPLHSYTGANRAARLSFMMLADHPDAAQKKDPSELGSFFWGCKTVIADNEPLSPRIPLLARGRAPKPAPPVTYGGTKPSCFFQNDSFTVDATYEQTTNGFDANYEIVDTSNLYALNDTFAEDLTALATYINFMRRGDNQITVKISGSCSALFTRDYNARLSFKRALALGHALVNSINAPAPIVLPPVAPVVDPAGVAEPGAPAVTPVITPVVEPTQLAQLVVSGWPTSAQIESEISVASVLNNKKYQVTSQDGSLIITLTGKGEEDAHNAGLTEGVINTEVAKRLRRASVLKVQSHPRVVPPPPGPEPSVSRQEQAQTALRAQANVAKKVASALYNPRFGGVIDPKQALPRGFAQRDYLSPVFHSQTPKDLNDRHEFLIQCTRPGNTKSEKDEVGANSLYGRAPVCILRLGDFIYSKVLIRSVQLNWQETKWDMNPEGQGFRPLLCKVDLDLSLLGGNSLQGPINTLLTATDFGYTAASGFNHLNLKTDQPRF